MLAAGQYFATYVLDDAKAITPLFVCLVAPAVLVMPLWMRVARARGKAFGYTAASLLFLAGALGLIASRSLPVAAIYLLVALCGIGYAGMQMFPLSLLPDVIADDAERTGANRAGVFTGVWTAGETAGFALGPAVVLAVLAIGGFVSSQPDEKVTQPDSAELAVLLAFSVLPALLILVSLPLLRRIGRASDLRSKE
jgi:glycoside/pentoside/hexuronide:cation symporter, GPH family